MKVATQALILAGGRGTRLGGLIGNANKPMVLIGGTPFLEFLLRQLLRHGLKRIIICTGYRAEAIESYFGGGERLGIGIQYSRESIPLGTAGAIKLAEPLIDSDPFVVMNADSILDLDHIALLNHHAQKAALLTLALVMAPDADRYGTVETDATGRILRFGEKTTTGTSLINAGVYCCSRKLTDFIPVGSPCSLERDVVPLLPASRVYGFAGDGYFVDIGIPEALRAVRADPDPLRRAAGHVPRC